MKIILSLIFILNSMTTLGCDFHGLEISLQSEPQEIGEGYELCSDKTNLKKMCKCIKKNKTFISPASDKLTELDNFEKKKYVNHAFKKAQKKLLAISQGIIALGSNPLFKNNEKIGRACNIDKLKIPKDCSESIFTREEMIEKVNSFSDKFKAEVKNAYRVSPDFEEDISDVHKNKNCNIPDSTFYNINFQSAQNSLGYIIKLVSNNSFPGNSLNEKMKFFTENNQSNSKEIQSINTLYNAAILNPIIRKVMDSPEALRKLETSQYSTESITAVTKDETIIKDTEKQIIEECGKTYDALTKVLCSPPKDVLPSSFDELKSVLTEHTPENDLIAYSQANQEIELFCEKNSQSQPIDDFFSIFEENVSPTILAAPSIRDATRHTYEEAIAPQYKMLCDQLEKSPKGLKVKMAELGCDSPDNVSQDCLYLKTTDILYGEQLSAPGASIASVFSKSAETKMPKIVEAFINDKDQTTPAENGSDQNEQINNNSSNTTNNVISGSKTSRMPASKNDNLISKEIEKEQRIANNMDNFYKDVYNKLNNNIDRKMADQSTLNPYAKTPSRSEVVTDMINNSFSGSEVYSGYNDNQLAYNDFQDDNSDMHFDALVDTTGDNVPYTPERSAEEKHAAEYAYGVKQMNDARMLARNAGKNLDVSTYKGQDIKDYLTIANMSHDSNPDHPTIEISDVSNLEDLLKTISSGNFPNKDKLMELLSKKDKGIFYIKSKENDNFIVKLIKDKKGNLKIQPYSRAPKKDRGYIEFYKSIQSLVKSNLGNTSKWLQLLKGIITEDDTYERALKL